MFHPTLTASAVRRVTVRCLIVVALLVIPAALHGWPAGSFSLTGRATRSNNCADFAVKANGVNVPAAGLTLGGAGTNSLTLTVTVGSAVSGSGQQVTGATENGILHFSISGPAGQTRKVALIGEASA